MQEAAGSQDVRSPSSTTPTKASPSAGGADRVKEVLGAIIARRRASLV